MTTKPKARKFRIRRSEPVSGPQPQAASPRTERQDPPPSQGQGQPPQKRVEPALSGAVDSPAVVRSESDIDTIRQEGLTGRQLRMARRVAQKNGIAVTSDFDAVRQLRLRGIDPFERNNILELVAPPQADHGGASAGNGMTPIGKIQLPQTVPQTSRELAPRAASDSVGADQRAKEILKIQRDMARRRRRSIAMLMGRLTAFVALPTLLCGIYYFTIATPMYATDTEFVIQQSQSAAGASAGLGSLFQGTSMATQQDSVTVQSFLTSRAALVRLDEEHNFRDHFSAPEIDAIQRLSSDAGIEEMYRIYDDKVKISYDPSEGIVHMEVVAADPATGQTFSEALISYAEEQVDQLTQRLRNDQMAGAQANFDSSIARRTAALRNLTDLQVKSEVINPLADDGRLNQRIVATETQRDSAQIALQTMLSNPSPNKARVDGLTTQIRLLDEQIASMRSQVGTGIDGNASLAEITAQLREAEENYQFEVAMVQQSQAALEAARIEADKQQRYLLVGVPPIAQDEPAYPRKFENTAVAFFIFAGIYLMISLTASILREQVNS